VSIFVAIGGDHLRISCRPELKGISETPKLAAGPTWAAFVSFGSLPNNYCRAEWKTALRYRSARVAYDWSGSASLAPGRRQAVATEDFL